MMSLMSNETSALRTYHVGLGAVRHIHDLDSDDLAAQRQAAGAAHDSGGAFADGLEQLVVHGTDRELPLPAPRCQKRALLPLRPHIGPLP